MVRLYDGTGQRVGIGGFTTIAQTGFATSGDSGTLHVQAHDGRVLSHAAVPIGSYNVQFAANRVITPSLSHGTLAVLDALGRPLRTLHVAGSCHDACVL